MAKQKFDRSKPHMNVGNDGTHRPREDDLDGGDHEVVCTAGDGRNIGRSTRSTMRRKRKRAGSRST